MAPGLGRAARDKALELRAALAGAGIPATLEPDQVATERGGAWITMRTITPLTMDEGYEVRFHIYLVAPEMGALQALEVLGDLLTKALTVIEPDEPINTAAALTLPHTPTVPLPAYLLVSDEMVDANEEDA